MFVFIPVRTDAPIYYWPFATVGMIAANVVAFALTGMGTEADGWILEFGNGLHPLQWVSGNFVHFGFVHLVGNMLFLWIFGLVVEGKLGWWKFLLVYFGIGVGGAIIEQVVMLGGDGGSGGASLIVYGLMAISLVWAPRNEIDVWCLIWVVVFIVRLGTWEVSILTLSALYIGLDVLVAVWTGFEMSSSVLHLIGAALGFAVGTLLLKRGWVDCENWDLFAVMAGTHGARPEPRYDAFGRLVEPATARRRQRPLEVDEETAPARAAGGRNVRRRFRELLDADKPRAAVSEFLEGQRLMPDWKLDRAELEKLIDALHARQAVEDAAPFLEEYVERFPDAPARMRLRLAGFLVQEERRPQAALRVLRGIVPGTISEKGEAHRRRIEEAAERLLEEGVIELSDPRSR